MGIPLPVAPRGEASPVVTIAAAGDVHAQGGLERRLAETFARAGATDLILLAGDLTATGAVSEARVLAAAASEAAAPVVAVLGNHDYHLGLQDEIAAALGEAGVCVLERGTTCRELHGITVGIAGTKGFVGGFLDARLPDFGEPLLREVYAETSRDVDALDEGLQEIAACDVRIVLLHYAPTQTTLEGERETLWTFLGSERLAAPIARWQADLVLHGHAHAGSPAGTIGSVPVLNVAQPVIDDDFATIVVGATAGEDGRRTLRLPAATRPRGWSQPGGTS
jgi:Icc-related predicted phosphoesterase